MTPVSSKSKKNGRNYKIKALHCDKCNRLAAPLQICTTKNVQCMQFQKLVSELQVP